MKQHMRILALVLAAILWSSLLPVAVAESYTGTINTDKVFFRMKASTEAGYYCKLEKKTKVTVTGVKGDFYKVTYDGNDGYVMKKFVNLSSAAQKALGTQESASQYAKATRISQLGGPPDYTAKGDKG